MNVAVFLEDAIAVGGVGVAAAGIGLTALTGSGTYDAVCMYAEFQQELWCIYRLDFRLDFELRLSVYSLVCNSILCCFTVIPSLLPTTSSLMIL